MVKLFGIREPFAAAESGLFVFPLHWTDEAGVCSSSEGADCKHPGKHPLYYGGYKDATRDPDQILDWWWRTPDANIGIATEQSELVVIDVDGKEGRPGPELWRKLVEEYRPEFEATTIVDTASGTGFHVYYRAAGHHFRSRDSALGSGLDVKSLGGHVVGATSEIAGRPYAYRQGHGLERLADLPAALAERLAAAEASSRKPAVEARERSGSAPRDAGIIPEQLRNSTLFSMAGAMRRAGLAPEAILAGLIEQNALLCRPALDEAEVREIATGVLRYPSGLDSATTPGPETMGRRLHPVSIAELANEEPESVPIVVPYYAYEGCITDIAAVPKMGKTTLIFAAVHAVCTGGYFLDAPAPQGPAVYLTEEGRGTFLSAARRVGADQDTNLYPIFRRDAFGMSWPQVCEEVRLLCEELGAVLVVVDTLSDWAGIRGEDENSAGKALEAIEPLRALAELPGLAVIVVRHERKSGGEVGQAARGSSQFTGAVDVVVSLRRGTTSTQRRLGALSRFDDTPLDLVIELVDGMFKKLGQGEGLHHATQELQIFDLVPVGREYAVGVNDVADAVATEMSPATVRRVLDRLVTLGEVCAEQGTLAGRQTTAKGYWRPGDGDDDE
jgi:hypothetical protein